MHALAQTVGQITIRGSHSLRLPQNKLMDRSIKQKRFLVTGTQATDTIVELFYTQSDYSTVLLFYEQQRERERV